MEPERQISNRVSVEPWPRCRSRKSWVLSQERRRWGSPPGNAFIGERQCSIPHEEVDEDRSHRMPVQWEFMTQGYSVKTSDSTWWRNYPWKDFLIWKPWYHQELGCACCFPVQSSKPRAGGCCFVVVIINHRRYVDEALSTSGRS